MDAEKVHIYSGPGYKLSAFLTLPVDFQKQSKRRVPGVVLCQGPGGYGMKMLTENDTLMIPVANWLAEAGYASLRFYYRGVGESEGPIYRLIPMEQVEDVISAVSYVQSREEIDPERIGLFGAAIGGSHASVAAAIDTRIKCIVSVNGIGNWQRWLQSMRSEQEWEEFLERVRKASILKTITGESESVKISEVIIPDPESKQAANRALKSNPSLAINLVSLDSALAMTSYRPEDYVSLISPRAALWIGAAGDALVPNLESETMYRNAGDPKKLELVQGVTHHGFYHRGEGFETMMDLASHWFNTYLKC